MDNFNEVFLNAIMSVPAEQQPLILAFIQGLETQKEIEKASA